MGKKKDWRDWLGYLALLGIMAGAAWLRFHLLELKPFHHDEGVNAGFVDTLVKDFTYKYNPYYYHGPSLYYITAPALLLFGKTAFAMRAAPALFGTLAVPAYLLVKDRLGWLGVLTCAVLTAISPIEVYFSRTAIHEIYNFTFNLTLVGGIYAWWQTRRRGYLVLAAASLGLLFATKETTAITVAAMVPAIVVTWLWAVGRRTWPGAQPIPQQLVGAAPRFWRRAHAADAPSPKDLAWPPEGAPRAVQAAAERLAEAKASARLAAAEALQAYREAKAQAKAGSQPAPPSLGVAYADLERGLPGGTPIPLVSFVFTFLHQLWKREKVSLIVSVAVFLFVWAFMFSSAFTYPKGLVGFFEAFFGWGQTGVEGKGHEKVWSYFIEEVLIPYYQPLVYVGLPALVVGAARRDAFATFNLLWFALTLTVYSIIPYKTPWCIISFTGPLFYGTGMAVSAVARFASGLASPALRPLVAALPLLVLAYPTYTWAQDSWRVNFDEYDVDGHSFIYVQNVREFMDMVDDLTGVLTAANAEGLKPSLYMLRAHNPVRWYIVQFDNEVKWANKYTDGIKAKLVESDIIITQQSQSKEVKEAIDLDKYVLRWYHERPGQKFDVFISKPVWAAYQAAIKAGTVPAPHEPRPPRSFSDDRTKQMRDEKKN